MFSLYIEVLAERSKSYQIYMASRTKIFPNFINGEPNFRKVLVIMERLVIPTCVCIIVEMARFTMMMIIMGVLDSHGGFRGGCYLYT